MCDGQEHSQATPASVPAATPSPENYGAELRRLDEAAAAAAAEPLGGPPATEAQHENPSPVED